jgi:Histidine phosphatase superfamily (branch 1)
MAHYSLGCRPTTLAPRLRRAWSAGLVTPRDILCSSSTCTSQSHVVEPPPPRSQQQRRQHRHSPQRRHFSDKRNGNDKSADKTASKSPTSTPSTVMSRTGPVSLGRTPRSMVASRRRGGADEASSQLNHILHGGALIPSDPVPPPFQLANFGEESLYTLVLLRHGESEWNSSNKYTGWCDVELTKKGEQEARDAGRLLYENGIELDHAFTSVLKRASFSCNMALNTARQHWVPVTKSWRLNER